jgi:hypothetical protein
MDLDLWIDKYFDEPEFEKVNKWLKKRAGMGRQCTVVWNLIREFQRAPQSSLVNEIYDFLAHLEKLLSTPGELATEEIEDPERLFKRIAEESGCCLPGPDVRGHRLNPPQMKSEECCWEKPALDDEPHPVKLERLCRVMTCQDFLKYHGPPADTINAMPPRKWAEMAEKKEGPLPNGELKGKRPFIFVSVLSEVIGLIGFPGKFPRSKKVVNELRNMLGLTYRRESNTAAPVPQDRPLELVLVKFPEGHEFMRVARPTFLDRPSEPFLVNMNEDAWGRLIHVETGNTGLREAVTCPQELSEKFEFEFVGECDYVDDVKYSKICPSRWAVEGLA